MVGAVQIPIVLNRVNKPVCFKRETGDEMCRPAITKHDTEPEKSPPVELCHLEPVKG